MSKILTERRAPLALVLIVLLLAVAGCDRSGRTRATVVDGIELTSDNPVAVVEFEGNLVVAPSADDIVASFSRLAPRNTRDMEQASVGRLQEEAWLDGAWVTYTAGSRPFIELRGGSNTVLYRWTLELSNDATSSTVPIEASLDPAYGGPGGVSAPGGDEVPTVTLRIVSVTYP